MRADVYESVTSLPDGLSAAALPTMPYPGGALLCPPVYFDVVDVKNPFMAGNAGAVDRSEASRQWSELCSAIGKAGAQIATLEAIPGCEDMVFCANTATLGLDADGAKTCVPARMTFASRRPEVAPVVDWCRAQGYRIVDAGDPSLRFEGGGDAVWHPGRRLIWGGYGWRSDPHVYPALACTFGTPVFALALTNSVFYHLDTCFCPIDERTVLVHAPAIAAEGMAMIRTMFERVIEVDSAEAERFACNAAAFFGQTIVIDQRAAATSALLRSLGYATIEVDTGEFLKSGGSVYCMKNAFYM